MTELKVGKLPDRTPVKLSISISPNLAEALTAYALLYREIYGQEETVTELIPAMLAGFLASDREFAKAQKGSGRL